MINFAVFCSMLRGHLQAKNFTLNVIVTLSLARATPVWKNRGLVTALHSTSSDGMQLADMVGRAAVAQLTKCKDGVNNN